LIIPKGWALHYNVSYMKYTAILFTILFLQGCTILESKPVQINPPLVVPNEWQAQGRAGVVFDGKSENAGFEVDFKGKNYRLTLTAALGLVSSLFNPMSEDFWLTINWLMLIFSNG